MTDNPLSKQELLEVLTLLNPQDAHLLRLRFGLPNSKPKSVKELADIFNKPLDEMHEELRRVERIALTKLQEMRSPEL